MEAIGKNASKYNYAYDSNNNLIGYIIQRWTNNTWSNSTLQWYEFDSKNNLIAEFDQSSGMELHG
ncbi:MAG: hypothetical protein IPG87_06335 [Saprospiraceae bacterium]|nr:hypothetical protein [Candidatus Vicinibacter affinis]